MNNLSLKEAFPKIIEIARFAPSVHNTQPWKVAQREDSIVISLDAAHALSDGDPTGRQTTISLGIFTEAIILAAESYGFTAEKVVLEDKTVTITCALSKKPAISAEKMAQLLRTRSSDRSVYQPVTITEQAAQRIERASKNLPVSVRIIQDKQTIEKIAYFTGKGIGLALSNPNFRQELSQYLVPPWSSKKRGISVKSLYINPILASAQPLMMRFGMGVGKEVSLEKKRWASASAVIVITAGGDLSQFWLATGRAYLHVSLAIEELGLSQATSAAVVEASDYHEDVEQLLGTNQRILSIIRIGKGSTQRRYSPRLEVRDLTT
jgi:nitroreductase